MIDSEEAIEMARRIIREEGIFTGMSSGAAMIAARRVAQRIPQGNIAVIFPDRAEKYLSTSMFDEFSDWRKGSSYYCYSAALIDFGMQGGVKVSS